MTQANKITWTLRLVVLAIALITVDFIADRSAEYVYNEWVK